MCSRSSFRQAKGRSRSCGGCRCSSTTNSATPPNWPTRSTKYSAGPPKPHRPAAPSHPPDRRRPQPRWRGSSSSRPSNTDAPSKPSSARTLAPTSTPSSGSASSSSKRNASPAHPRLPRPPRRPAHPDTTKHASPLALVGRPDHDQFDPDLLPQLLALKQDDSEANSLRAPPSAHNLPVLRPASERLTSPLTVGSDLQKRGSAQRWAATYSHGGVL